MMEHLLISACLLGLACRYDGRAHPSDCAELLRERFALVPVCPEQLGGLPTPRDPAERQGGRVVTKDGRDVTAQFRSGAEQTLLLARTLRCRAAVLKSRSPSCGAGQIYDGAFSRTLIPGDGVTAELLRANGVRVYTEQETERLLRELAP